MKNWIYLVLVVVIVMVVANVLGNSNTDKNVQPTAISTNTVQQQAGQLQGTPPPPPAEQ